MDERAFEVEKRGPTRGLIEGLPISKLRLSPFAVRSDVSGIEELARSIQENGLLHPIVVRGKNDYFEIIAGFRRYNACKLLGWRKITCHIVELDDKDSFEVSLIENIQRKSMNPIEEAYAYKKYVEEYGWGSIAELSRKIGKSSSYISKRLSLLDLPEDVLEKVRTKELTPSIAEELLRLDDPHEQSKLARLVSRRHLTLKRTRNIIIDNESNDGSSSEVMDPRASATEELQERAFDKIIAALRIALSKFGPIIEESEYNWIIHETIMFHKNRLHEQIDLLLKAKKQARRKARILYHKPPQLASKATVRI